MGEEERDGNSLSLSASIPPKIITAILGALGIGVFTLGTYVPQGLEANSLQACFDNAQRAIQSADTALSVAGQHGQEFVTVNARIDEVKEDIKRLRLDILAIQSTRHTAKEQYKYVSEHENEHDMLDSRHSQHERRFNSVEKDLDYLLDRVDNRWIRASDIKEKK